MNFSSDNAQGAHPAILDALAAVNDGPVSSYGADPVSRRVEARFAELFERPVQVFQVVTGSAANALSLAAAVPPWGAVLCHEASHIECDEANAPEFFTGGAKLLTLPGEGAKLAPDTVAAALSPFPQGVVHHPQAAAISITQATECGTVYTPGEIAALSEVARANGLALHMDGARFANALVALGVSPAEATWKAGVDILSFGATKNGCLAAEAILVFDDALAETLAFRRKRAGHLLSKSRFLAAQLDAYLADGLWLDLAAHANARAAGLAEALEAVPGVRLAFSPAANEVFAVLPPAVEAHFANAGVVFYPWVVPGLGPEARVFRFVTSFRTSEEEVARFAAIAKEAERFHTEDSAVP